MNDDTVRLPGRRAVCCRSVAAPTAASTNGGGPVSADARDQGAADEAALPLTLPEEAAEGIADEASLEAVTMGGRGP